MAKKKRDDYIARCTELEIPINAEKATIPEMKELIQKEMQSLDTWDGDHFIDKAKEPEEPKGEDPPAGGETPAEETPSAEEAESTEEPTEGEEGNQESAEASNAGSVVELSLGVLIAGDLETVAPLHLIPLALDEAPGHDVVVDGEVLAIAA